MKSVLITIYMLLLIASAFGQSDSSYENHLKELCSDEFSGRGYLYEGHTKAASYIKSKFNSIGLETSLQAFTLVANLIGRNQANVEFYYSDKGWLTLVPGNDYVFDACTKKSSGTYEVKNYAPEDKKSVKRISKAISKDNCAIFYRSTSIHADMNDKLRKTITTCSIQLISQKAPIIGISNKQNCPTKIMIFESLVDSLGIPDSIKFFVKPELRTHRTQNVLGFSKGSTDTTVVVCAHYDHIGTQNTAIFRGANDNASGTAMMLDIARKVHSRPHKYNYLFIAFSGEEAGLIGSRYYVNNPLIPLSKIKFVLNLDLMGSGSLGLMVVNGTEHEREFNLLKSFNNSLKTGFKIGKRRPAPNSDHYPFYVKGVKTFFIYSRGEVGGYHNVYDLTSKLEKGYVLKMEKLFLNFLLNL